MEAEHYPAQEYFWYLGAIILYAFYRILRILIKKRIGKNRGYRIEPFDLER